MKTGRVPAGDAGAHAAHYAPQRDAYVTEKAKLDKDVKAKKISAAEYETEKKKLKAKLKIKV